jgi:hypothetical protein
MYFKQLIFCSALLALAPPAFCSLILTLSPSTLSGVPGGSVIFSGTIVDTDAGTVHNGDFVYLNDIAVIFDPPGDSLLSAPDTFFINTVPGDLIGDTNPIDNTYSGPIFEVDIAPNTPAGTYTGTFSILGGYTEPLADFDVLATQTFQVVVPAPEPATAGLLLLPLAGLAAVIRRRRQR